jgi:predicted nucleic acid-binding protein
LTACVLDTDVVIAALDRQDAHHTAAKQALEKLIGAGAELSMSTVNYAEALVRPAADEQALAQAVDAIGALGIRAIPPSAQAARDAARYRTLGISLADGFALATARTLRASVASFDHRVQRASGAAGLDLEAGFE